MAAKKSDPLRRRINTKKELKQYAEVGGARKKRTSETLSSCRERRGPINVGPGKGDEWEGPNDAGRSEDLERGTRGRVAHVQEEGKKGVV